MSVDPEVVVIGAGPAGLTAAYCLAKAGKKVRVYEAGPLVGGLARSFELWGQTVDLGPHRFFSSDRRVNALWLEVVGKDYRMVDRLTRIFYRQKFFHYPLKPVNALQNLGPLRAAMCMASYARERMRPTPQDGTFESWVTGRFGKELYEIFFKTYSEKLWGISCRELDADFAAQRIKGLSLFEAAKNAVLAGRGNKHKTLVDQFAYPLGGTGSVYQKMRERIEEMGGTVHLKAPVKRIILEDGAARGVELMSAETVRAQKVISSMPLTLMVKGLDPFPEEAKQAAQKLRFRNTIVIYLHIDSRELFPDQWVYVHSSDLDVGRITNFRNWVPELNQGKSSTIVAMEYWCYDDDPVWKEDDAVLIARASKEFVATGLAPGHAPIKEGHVVRVPRCYPVYARGYQKVLDPMIAALRAIRDLEVIGRYGAFKYNNQDHSILMGILAAENFVKNAGHDLWAVNTDMETYQEESRITDTGLAVGGKAA